MCLNHLNNVQWPRTLWKASHCQRFIVSVVVKEGVVTLMGPVEPFVTMIKMKSIKGSTCQFVLNQAIKECFKEVIKQLIIIM